LSDQLFVLFAGALTSLIELRDQSFFSAKA
jgi:hypothetical protein